MPQSSVPMPPNQPTAPPGPLTLGDLFSSTVATYKRGWKLLVPLACVPIAIYAVALVVLGILMAVVLMPVLTTRNPDFGAAAGPIIGVSVLAVVGLIALSIFCYVFYGRVMLASLDYATGRDVPTWATLAQRTQGLMGRLVGFAAICAGVGLAVYLVFGVIVGVAALGLGRNNSGVAAFVIFLAVVALGVAAMWVSIKIIYTVIVMAEERLKAMDAFKRSFALTKGAFWRTLGYSLVIGLVVGVITSIPQGMMNTGLQNATEGGGFGVLGVLGGLLVLLLNIALIPITHIWTSLMYLGRTRELANIAAGYPASGYVAGYGAAGAPWHDAGQPFGQAPGQYDQGGYDPNAGYPGASYPSTTYPPQNAYGTPGAGQYPQAGAQQPDPFSQSDPFGGQAGRAPQGGAPFGMPGGGAPQGTDPYQQGGPAAPQGEQGQQRPDDQQPPSGGDYFGRPQH